MVKHRYWDSCVILGWLKGEQDKIDECRAGIKAAEKGDIQIITSSLTLAEVLHLKGKDKIPKADREKVRGFFENDYIALYDVDRTIAELAQDVVWDHGIAPKDAIHVAIREERDIAVATWIASTCIAPKDAIHVATAMSLSSRIALDQFDTFDEPLIERSGKIGEPGLKIGRPNLPIPMF